ncbi:MAG: hypothetical protein NUV91_08050 [Candidatus Omnitrophica bacterium]|nr:hypothetical protein [Candidatus Omnitrophota bacterium]
MRTKKALTSIVLGAVVISTLFVAKFVLADIPFRIDPPKITEPLVKADPFFVTGTYTIPPAVFAEIPNHLAVKNMNPSVSIGVEVRGGVNMGSNDLVGLVPNGNFRVPIGGGQFVAGIVGSSVRARTSVYVPVRDSRNPQVIQNLIIAQSDWSHPVIVQQVPPVFLPNLGNNPGEIPGQGREGGRIPRRNPFDR